MICSVATDPGGAGPNEDWAAVVGDVAIVLDGQTARTGTGCVHGVAWYTGRLGSALAYQLRDPARALTTALAESVAMVAAEHPGCDLGHPGTPSAVIGIARVFGDAVEYAVLGDVSIVIETTTGLRVVTDDRVSVATRAEREAAVSLPADSDERRRALAVMKHAEHAARNRPGGFWVAAADPAAAQHAIAGATAGVRRAALLSDGAARAVRLFGLLDWPAALDLMATATTGPGELIRRVRAAEATDAAAARWPRTKAADDATAVYVDLTTRLPAHQHQAPPDSATRPEPQPVVAAVVTSDRGVLVGRRNDGRPPWTLIAGEIEPGESPADAAVREVKEETGLQVDAGAREVGRRVHPTTGRTMIYLACRPVGKTDVFVGDPVELAEVRWVELAEVERLLPGLYEPVWRHLVRELGGDQ